MLASSNGTSANGISSSYLASVIANKVAFLLDDDSYILLSIAKAGLTNNVSQFQNPITACSVLTCQYLSLKKACVAFDSLFIFSEDGPINQLDVNSTPGTSTEFLVGRTQFKGFGGNFLLEKME